ncbi:AAA family ATPase [Methylobacterium sp. NPDC080182]|uniref:AAA family ATPase n=1 Tax=Methylobacterium sp. NPDC080182 TaxID=3390590 RepID=UPI003D02E98D
MAIAFARARYIGRSSGGSATRSAAYNARTLIPDQRTGETFTFAHRGAPTYHAVLLPAGADPALAEAAVLWNRAEAAERRQDAQVAREIVLALPANADLSPQDRIALARGFALEHFVAKGLAVQIDVHAPHAAESEGERANHHAHLLITTRRVEGAGLSPKKARDLDPEVRQGAGGPLVAEAEAWGATWRDYQDRYFAAHGLEIRVDPTAAVPAEHIGPVRMRAPEAAANARAEEIRRANALAARDPTQVLEALTRTAATFTARELDRYLAKHLPDAAERATVRDRVLGSGAVLALHDPETGAPVGRYTTRTVRGQERAAMADGAAVAAGRHRALTERARAAAPGATMLRPDQRAAFDHAAGAGGLKLVIGRAGTGKSFTLDAVRDAHAAAGYRVIGLAPTNTVAQDLAQAGFARAGTVHAELFALKNGRTAWDRGTLVVVDEAAMLDTRVLGALLAEARLSGAKLVLAGDDRQLAAIERGGLFPELVRAHGAAEIRHVTRQRVDWQRQAAQDLADGRFEPALRGFARHEALVWTRTQDEALAALVARWTRDSAADPNAARFVFAYTNAEVDALNAALRRARRERGELGADHRFTTKHGAGAFALGDRVQITETWKAAGLYNGHAGVIVAIAADRISLRLDAPAGRAARVVTWAPSGFDGYRLGYAGTIYKGQGRTLDHTYLLHSKFWRSASAYVALTRQRLGVAVFAATETAADLRQLARQMGRSEVKAASLAFAAPDELTPAQRRSLSARPRLPEPVRRPADSPGLGVRPVARRPGPDALAAAVLIPAFVGAGRDSLGRGLDAASLAAAVAGDAAVIRARAERAATLGTAYRDPAAALRRLDALLARDGSTSAARRLAAEPEAIGRLRGRTGLFAGAGARAERQTARAAAAVLGANLTRMAEADARAQVGYRAAVEAQMRADATAIPVLSGEAVTALTAFGGRAEGRVGVNISTDAVVPEGLAREVRAFRAAVEARFGAAGARTLLGGGAVDPVQVPDADRSALTTVGELYGAACRMDAARARAMTVQRVSARHSRDIGIRL